MLTKIHGGGARDRKRKLLDKQKKGKSRAKQFGKVEIPESGSVSVPLTQWGGRFGKDGTVDFDEFVDDDGITNRKEGGLSLRVETEAVGKTGSWKVYAKIV